MLKSVVYLSSKNGTRYGYVTSMKKANLYMALHPGTYSSLDILETDKLGMSYEDYLKDYKCLDTEVDESRYTLKYICDISYILKRGRIIEEPIDIKWTPYIGNMSNYITTDKKWFKTIITAHLILDHYDAFHATEVSLKMIKEYIRNGGV